MTPEERAAQAVQAAALDWGGHYELDAPRLEAAITTAIRAAVAEAVAMEREVIATRLEFVAGGYSEGDPDYHIAVILQREAAAIRSQGEGEGDTALS